MYSFYGGQEGRTYHIVKKYKSIHDMCEEFKNSNSQVMYHEYVLIDTTKEGGTGINDYENGCLYRRGFNLSEETYEETHDGHRPEPTYNQGGTVILNQDAIDEYLEHPGAGAIYVGCIRGSDGPGLLINETTSTYHTVTTNSSSSITTVTASTRGKLNQATVYDLNFNFPVPKINVAAVNKNTDNTASVTLTPVAGNPYYINSTYGIPQGLHGHSITDVTLNDAKNRLGFTISSYQDATTVHPTIIATPEVAYNIIDHISTYDNNPNIIAVYETNKQNPTTFSTDYTRAINGHYTISSSSLNIGSTISTQTGWPTPSSFCIFVEAGTGSQKHPYLLAPNGTSSWVVIQDLQAQAQPELVVQVNDSTPSGTLRTGGLDFVVSTGITITPFGG